MQVNTRATHDAIVARMTSVSAQLDQVNTSIATGKRIQSPDDDPVGAARLATIDRALVVNAAQQRGIDRAASRLGAVDAALDGVSTLLQRFKEITLQGATATLNADDRATLAAEVAQVSDQLRGLANTRDGEGGAVFAGTRTGGDAYAADAQGAMRWQGAGTAAVLALDDGTIATSIDGPAVFDGIGGGPMPTTAFAMLADLAAALGETDPDLRATAMATAQSRADAAISRVADTRAAVGTRLARLDTESTRLDAATLRLERDKASTGAVDMASAIARLQRLSTVLQAAQLGFAKVSTLSLWDTLR